MGKSMQDIISKAANIKLAIFDVDGVLTDGTLYYTDATTEIKAFHAHDGLGLKLLQQSGITVAIITSHDTPLLAHRMKVLGIEHFYAGQQHKVPAYEDLLSKLNVSDEQTSYMGDDLPDLPLIRRAALGITVPNAVDFVRQYADWETNMPGGRGAVREVSEVMLKAQGTFDRIHQNYLG